MGNKLKRKGIQTNRQRANCSQRERESSFTKLQLTFFLRRGRKKRKKKKKKEQSLGERNWALVEEDREILKLNEKESSPFLPLLTHTH